MEIVAYIGQAIFDFLILHFFGWKVLSYLFIGTVLGCGVHPLAAHFVGEHYLWGKYETYSYYGPLNYLVYNVGWHNEHHDFPRIPGSRLPQLHKIAPEFYKDIGVNSSWPGVILRFIFDDSITPFSRMQREGKVRDKEDIIAEERTNNDPVYDELAENNTVMNLIFTDTSGFTSDNVNGQNNDDDIEFDEAELDEYVRDDDEVETFKKVWESLQSNITEKSDKDKNTRFKKTMRLKRLREKDGEDRISSHSEHISSTGESSSTYTGKNKQKTAKNKRARAKESKSVNKLNFSLIDNINFDEFDHI
jgi:hypothetical protein